MCVCECTYVCVFVPYTREINTLTMFNKRIQSIENFNLHSLYVCVLCIYAYERRTKIQVEKAIQTPPKTMHFQI